MSLRSRIILATALSMLIPFLIISYLIRSGVKSRLTDMYIERVDNTATLVENDLSRRGHDLAAHLERLKAEVLNDNQFRLSLAQEDEELARYRIDYAGHLMELSGLSLLQIQKSDGHILSSGHFRNSYDQFEQSLASMPIRAEGVVTLVQARTAEGDLLALGQRLPFQIGEEELSLVGGIEVAGGFLAGLGDESNLQVQLRYPHEVRSEHLWIREHLLNTTESTSTLNSDDHFIIDLELFFVAPEGTVPERGTATLQIGHAHAPLQSVLRNLDVWLAAFLLVIIIGSLLLAVWISGRISRPLRDLAEEVTAVDVDRLNVELSTDRKDEVGELSRFLAGMTDRLRSSVASLRDAERRAALADLARQVNHDIRNGFTPIRNVMRHLKQVARESPEDLGLVFRERQEQIESGLAYLEELSANYARMSPRQDRRPIDLNTIVKQVCADMSLGVRRTLKLRLEDRLPSILADPIGLRRVVENLVRNASESLEGEAGEVSVATSSTRKGERHLVTLIVADTGKGIDPEDKNRVFEHFYTTKEDGTGLGLSIVRRLVSDFDGRISLESEPGKGTRFAIQFPQAPKYGTTENQA